MGLSAEQIHRVINEYFFPTKQPDKKPISDDDILIYEVCSSLWADLIPFLSKYIAKYFVWKTKIKYNRYLKNFTEIRPKDILSNESFN